MTQKSPSTLLIHPSREVPKGFRSLVPGTERASTVLFDNTAKWKSRSGFDESIYTYGTSGTPTTRDLHLAVLSNSTVDARSVPGMSE